MPVTGEVRDQLGARSAKDGRQVSDGGPGGYRRLRWGGRRHDDGAGEGGLPGRRGIGAARAYRGFTPGRIALAGG